MILPLHMISIKQKKILYGIGVSMKIRLSRIFLVFCCATALSAEAQEYRSEQTEAAVLDSFYPLLERDHHFWLRTDLLVFRPKEKSIVLTNQNTNLFTTADVTLQPDVKPCFTWDAGVRIGFGYIFPNCMWDVALNLTHFETCLQQCRSTQDNIGLGMFPIWSLADDIIPFDWVSKAKMQWKLNLNLFDLDFGRVVSCADQFFIRFIIGLRVAVIKQHLDVFYGGGIFANGLNLPALDSTFGYDVINMKNNFWSIGPRLGIEPQLNLGCGWRLYTSACAALGFSSFDVCQKEVYLTDVRYNRSCSPQGVRWIVDATAGILWKTFLCENRYALMFALGWEYHHFFDQVEFKGDRFGKVSHDRDLSLNGLALSMRFDF